MDYGADLNHVFKGIQSALMSACRKSDLDMAQFLLEHGADPNIIGQYYDSALSRAASKAGNLQLVELLLNHGADVGLGNGCVFHQASFGGERILACLLQQPMTQQDRERFLNTALQSAAHWTKLDLCKWLLDQSANPGFRGGTWGCALTAAVSNQHIIDSAGINNRRLIIDLLLRRGANINPSPMPNAEPNHNPDVDADMHPSPLTAALNIRAHNSATMLLAAGADPNIPGGNLHTSLQSAARYCSSMVGPLLAAGADPNIVGGAQFGTALHAAAYAHEVESIKLLLAAGADVCAMGGKYGTVLQAAAKRDTVNSGWTAERESVATMKTLVAAGADVHAREGKYDSVLQMSAKSGNLEAVRWLVERTGLMLISRGDGTVV